MLHSNFCLHFANVNIVSPHTTIPLKNNMTPCGNKPKVSMKFNLVVYFVSFTRYLPKKCHMVTTKWIPHLDQKEKKIWWALGGCFILIK
jgi:hypothetical protein